jgi:protein TonB
MLSNNVNIYHYLDLDKLPTLIDGGNIQHYINKNTIWPIGFHGDGKVYVSFVIDTAGLCKNVRIIKTLTKECDSIAVRVINSIPKVKPGEISSRKVNTLIFTYVDFSIY